MFSYDLLRRFPPLDIKLDEVSPKLSDFKEFRFVFLKPVPNSSSWSRYHRALCVSDSNVLFCSETQLVFEKNNVRMIGSVFMHYFFSSLDIC